MMMKLSASIFLCIFPITLTVGKSDSWGWAPLDVSMPKAISDHTANLNKDNGLIYITGGCDDPEGNKFIATDDGGIVICNSISNSVYTFDPMLEEFDTLPEMPRERYRHSAAIVDGKIWVTGGRTLDDDLIAEVDVYDISSREWTTFGSTPGALIVSDHASFSSTDPKPYVYVAGGYNDLNYTVALKDVYRIDVDASLAENVIKLDTNVVRDSAVAPMNTGRGDIIAAVSSDGNSAFVAGGFTPENDWCGALGSVEEYSFADNTWYQLPDLIDERAEVVLVELDNFIYALGGERPIEDICEITEVEVSELTVGTDLVEVLDRDGVGAAAGTGEWKVLERFDDHIFRFAAVGIPETNLIYAFGGQTSWSNDCECFRTVNQVLIFGDGVSSSNTLFGNTMISLVVMTITTASLMVWNWI